MQRLSARQRDVLEVVKGAIQRTSRPPTLQEIGAHLKISHQTAAQHVAALATKGWVALTPNEARGIRIIALPKAAEVAPLTLPLVGRVAAGQPIMSEPNYEDYYRVDPRLFHPQADFLLRVKGQSMSGAGILDGDLLAVHQMPTADNGQIVVARVGDELTVKRFERRGTVVLLKPENPDFGDIGVDLRDQEVAIEGIYVGHIHLASAGGARINS